MGSSGSGRFTDYRGSGGRPKNGNGGNGEGAGGPAGGVAPCDQVINAQLEEVERCAYYLQRGLPPAGTVVSVRPGRRVSVFIDDLELGYLPTSYNYLVTCFEHRYAYSGTVTSSIGRPFVRVNVNIVPVAPP